MRLRQLECFRALMLHGTMTRAAELLGMSQPGISAMIANLERATRLTLFVRRGGRLQPTPEGKLFYVEAARALEAVENAARIAGEIRTGRRGHLAIAAYPSISISLLPRVLSQFSRGRPELQLKIITRNSATVRELMSTQQFDIAVAELPLDYPTSQMEVFSYECVCMLPKAHPLARKRQITPNDLDGIPLSRCFEATPSINSSLRRFRIMARAGTSSRRRSFLPAHVNWWPPAAESVWSIPLSAGRSPSDSSCARSGR